MAFVQPQTLEDLLLKALLISPDQLTVAQREGEKRNRRLAPMLLELGFVGEHQFAEWISQVTSIPIVDPLPAAAVAPLVRRVPRAIAREYEIVPVALEQGILTIATINPLDSACLEVLRATTAMTVRPVIAIYSQLLLLLARFYPEDSIEATLMPQALFDPGATMAVPGANDSPGSTTRIIPASVAQLADDTNPVVEVKPVELSRLDGIDRAIADLRRMTESLHGRLDTIDQTLQSILKRT